MKRFILTAFMCIMAIGLSRADEKIITRDVNRLPATSREFIAKHLPGSPVSHIKIEKGWFGIKEYEVILTNGVEIKFDGDGHWEEVEGHRNALATTFIPDFIVSYIRQYYPEASVFSVEKDRNRYEVKLSNRLELKFDTKGNLLDIDR